MRPFLPTPSIHIIECPPAPTECNAKNVGIAIERILKSPYTCHTIDQGLILHMRYDPFTRMLRETGISGRPVDLFSALKLQLCRTVKYQVNKASFKKDSYLYTMEDKSSWLEEISGHCRNIINTDRGPRPEKLTPLIHRTMSIKYLADAWLKQQDHPKMLKTGFFGFSKKAAAESVQSHLKDVKLMKQSLSESIILPILRTFAKEVPKLKRKSLISDLSKA